MRRTPLTMGEWRRYIDQTEATRPSNPQDPAVAWPETWPAVMMSWHEALGYAAWASEETGRDWRLPAELEREKAIEIYEEVEEIETDPTVRKKLEELHNQDND